MGWFLNALHLPPIGTETVPHIDIASAALALLALIFSVYTFFHQRRIRLLSVIALRNSGLIRWIELAIDTVVDVEFMLRSWTPAAAMADYLARRDEQLAKLAAVIDKGRLYFPKFTRDVIGGQVAPASADIRLPLLDDLVEIYDLTKKTSFQNEDAVKATQNEVMMKKLDFIKTAQKQVEFRRVPGIVE